jgi:hypothetical protein
MLISHQVYPAPLLGVSAGYFQRALADGSGMIRTQMGTHSRSIMDALLETPCTITPRYYKCNNRLRSSETLVIKCRQEEVSV